MTPPLPKPKIIPDGWVPPAAAIAWIVSGSAETSWKRAFYEGADKWPDTAPWDTVAEVNLLLEGRSPENGVIWSVAVDVSNKARRRLRYDDEKPIWQILDDDEGDERAPEVRRFLIEFIDQLREEEKISDALWKASDELRAAIARGDIAAFGYRVSDADDASESPFYVKDARERIPPEVCAAPVTIGRSSILPFIRGDIVIDGWQALWVDVLVYSADLLRLRSAPADGAPTVPYKPSHSSAADIEARSKGGRPPNADREAFDAEVVRIVSMDGGETRTELKRMMKAWAEDNMKQPFDDRTVEKLVNRLTKTVPFADD